MMMMMMMMMTIKTYATELCMPLHRLSVISTAGASSLDSLSSGRRINPFLILCRINVYPPGDIMC
jgi:hypothetical protein